MEKYRKIIRLQEYDYRENGAYFVTVCTQNKEKLFWDGETPPLNPRGEMVLRWLNKLPERFSGVTLDCYAVMPNHIHLILSFSKAEQPLQRIMEWYKTMTTNDYIRGVKAGVYPPFAKRIWQRSYYEHVIRNETDLYELRKYISENPLKWQLDQLYGE